MKPWVVRFLRRGLSPLIARQTEVIVLSVVAMVVSIALLMFVELSGGLVELLAKVMAALCLSTGNCQWNILTLQTAAPIIVAVQVAIMLARMASVNDRISVQVQTELEDADLLAAVVSAGQEESKNATGT